MDGVLVDWDRGFEHVWESILQTSRNKQQASHITSYPQLLSLVPSCDPGQLGDGDDGNDEESISTADDPHKTSRVDPLALIDRSLSYAMEECVPTAYKALAKAIYHTPSFFRHLPPMEGAVEAIQEMEALGCKVIIVTSPGETLPTLWGLLYNIGWRLIGLTSLFFPAPPHHRHHNHHHHHMTYAQLQPVNPVYKRNDPGSCSIWGLLM